MYNEISSNRRRTALLFSIVIIIYIALGWLLSEIYHNFSILIIALAISAIQSWIGYYYSDKIALSTTGAKGPIKKSDAPTLFRTVENLCITTGLPMPAIYIIPSASLNAFATGRKPELASLAITSGLLERLEKVELEGVIAHELSHIKNRDILTMTVAVVMIGGLALLSNLFVRGILWGNRRDNQGNNGFMVIIGLVALIIAPIVGNLIQLAISRRREYLADADGALMTRYPEGLARALEKISRSNIPMESANQATAHLFISSPFRGSQLSQLLSTHPPIEDRIKRLRKMITK